MPDIRNGSMSFSSTMDNDQMIAAIDETLRRIQGLSDGTVEGTMKMSEAFSATAAGVARAIEAIDDATQQHESELEKLRSKYSTLADERSKAFTEGHEEEMRTIQEEIDKVRGEIGVREELVRELKEAGLQLRTESKALAENTRAAEGNANAHQTIKARIKELKDQMAEMRLKGIDEQSEAYRRLRDELGRLADIQGDIATQSRILSNDDAKFQGIINGAQGATAAMSLLTGAYGLFGEENKELQQIMLKVQSLMAITMGMQQVSQVLNKDSAFMLTTIGGLKQWWADVVAKATVNEVAETAATEANTIAEGKNAVSIAADTKAIEANSAARGQNMAATTAQTAATGANAAAATAGTAANIGLAGAFRLVGAAIKSIPVFGWIVAGISALVGVLVHFKSKADEARKAALEFGNKVAESVYKPIGNIHNLSQKWNELGNDMAAKEKFVRENQKAFENLGIAVDSVTAAENALVRNKDKFIAAQIAKAKATILLEQGMEKLRAAMEKREERDQESSSVVKLGINGWYSPWKQKNEEFNKLQKEADDLFKQARDAEAEGWEILNEAGIEGSDTYAEGSIGALEKLISQKQALLKKMTDPTEYAAAAKEIEGLQKQIEAITGEKKTTTTTTTKTQKTPEEERTERLKKALDTMRAEYDRFNKWVNSGDEILVNAARDEFKDLISQGESYVQYLKNQRDQILSIAEENRTVEQTQWLNLVNDQIAQEAKQTVLESFTKELNAQLEQAKTISDMLDIIEKRRQELDNDNTELDNAKSEALNDAEKDILNNAKSEYEAMLKEYGTFEQRKAALAEEFAKKRAIAEREGNSEMISEIEKAEKEALSKFALDELMKSPDWELMFGDLDELSTKKLEELLDKINGMTAYLGVEFSPEDLAKLKETVTNMKAEIQERNPFKALKASLKDYSEAVDAESKKKALTNVFKAASASADIVTASIKGIQDGLSALGVEADAETSVILNDLAKMGAASSQIAEGIATNNPISIIQGSVSLLTSAFDLFNFKDRAAERQIKRHQNTLKELQSSYQQLSWTIDKALGGDKYKGQKDAIRNMESQITQLQGAISAENSKKKTDDDRIKDWQDQIAELRRNISDMYDEIAKDILQTDAKDFANQLGDSLAEAFATGEDAAKAFEKTVNDVLKNAIVNQLKKNFLEKQLQGTLDELERSMGSWVGDTFHFDGLTNDEIQMFRNRVQAIADTYNQALEQYSEIFQNLTDENESSLVGAVKGVTEETAEIISGQLQAIRINQAESVAIMRNAIETLERIAANTSYNHHLAKMDRIVSLLEGSKTDAVLRASGIQV